MRKKPRHMAGLLSLSERAAYLFFFEKSETKIRASAGIWHIVCGNTNRFL